VTRDSTALTIAEVTTSELGDGLPLPRFHVVFRRQWTGLSQVDLYRQIMALVDQWAPSRLVIDATGVGEGLASFLAKSHPSKVIPFKFTQASKSSLGWKFISLLETGRYKEYACVGQDGVLPANLSELSNLQQTFYQQARFCLLEILPGPSKTIRWGVPDGARDPATGELVHDDLLISSALLALLEGETFGSAESAVLQPYDPLSEMTF